MKHENSQLQTTRYLMKRRRAAFHHHCTTALPTTPDSSITLPHAYPSPASCRPLPIHQAYPFCNTLSLPPKPHITSPAHLFCLNA